MSMREPIVFVVDDDQAMREALRWLLESVDWTVETFASAGAFLEAYRPGRPGCLLLDVRMPGMSGLELQEEEASITELQSAFTTLLAKCKDAWLLNSLLKEAVLKMAKRSRVPMQFVANVLDEAQRSKPEIRQA